MTTRQYLAQVDRMISAGMVAHTSCCAKGCHHCCSEPLYVDEREAVLMLECLDPSLEQQVASQTEAWISKATPLLDKDMPSALGWRMLDNPCPFLIDGLCSVYDVRPMGCRTFFAMGNPDDCQMPQREHQKFAVFPDKAVAQVMYPFAKSQDRVVMDHLGVFLAKKLLGIELASTSRMDMATDGIQQL